MFTDARWQQIFEDLPSLVSRADVVTIFVFLPKKKKMG